MNVSLMQLWLPILLGTVLAWIASGLIHMLLKYHNNEYQRLANEDEVMDAIRSAGPSLGMHSFPHSIDMNDFRDEAVRQRFERGPVGFVFVLPNGLPAMGKLMSQQIAHFLVGSLLVGYCATLALAPGAAYFDVFRFVLPVAFLAFGWASIPYSIWFGLQWSMTLKFLLDALIYAALIAGTFAAFWPPAG
jgi:hypothetical protein